MGEQTRVFIKSALFQLISKNTRQNMRESLHTFALARGRRKTEGG